ncbi:PepSY domain-containing protein [Sphingomonas sp. JC676]|uniref:PepSY domain-containing protein n=1 Tax=Sphingomonas sp. JC676 TaxID=2768065 RepID=UPI001657B2CB|nr:PepSY domain-containing protein [Sphingomonas sp. JC676]MBC9033725.1 PepSY domain-containing protein [Sphingomonas sp. JC676]
MTIFPVRVAAITVAPLLIAAPGATGAAAHPNRTAQLAQPAPITFAGLERRAIARGLRPTELKIKAHTAKIEGRDSQGREVEIRLDLRTGEVLHRELDD